MIDVPLLPPVPTQIETVQACMQSGTPGPQMIRRLTNEQLNKTLQQVFASNELPQAKPLNDVTVLGFLGDASILLISDQSAQTLMDHAEQVASWGKDKINQRLPCQDPTRDCYQTIAQQLGTLMFRGPIPEERVAAYAEVAAQEPDFQGAIEVMLQAMIQSPYFVYRREIGTSLGNQRFELSSYEVASLISYGLQDEMPDAELWAAAQANALKTVDQIKPHIVRLLNTPNGLAKLQTFVRQWLEVDKIKSVAKDAQVMAFGDDLRSAMFEESNRLIQDLIQSKQPPTALFNAPHTYLNRTLASHYQLNVSMQGDDYQKVMLPEQKDQSRPPGILGHGSILASHAMANRSSPVQRGVWVRRRILCEQVPPPPSGLATSLKEEDAQRADIKTTRQLFEISHMQLGASCKSCHEKIDPIGFLFEGFDAFGRKRTQENGQTVDTTGALILPDDSQVPLDDAFALSETLGQEQSIEPCMIRYLMYQNFGQMTWPQNGCTLDEVQNNLGNQASLVDIAAALFAAPHVLERVASP